MLTRLSLLKYSLYQQLKKLCQQNGDNIELTCYVCNMQTTHIKEYTYLSLCDKVLIF